MGDVLTENRNGLVVVVRLTQTGETAEREAALGMIGGNPPSKRVTLGGDLGYDTRGFVAATRELKVRLTSHRTIPTGAAPSANAPLDMKATPSANESGRGLRKLDWSPNWLKCHRAECAIRFAPPFRMNRAVIILAVWRHQADRLKICLGRPGRDSDKLAVDLGFQESDLDELAVTIETIAGSAVPLCLRIGKLIDDCLGRGTCSPAVKKELLGLLAHIRLSTVLTDCLRQSVTVGELAEHTNIYLQRHEPISLIAQERELATESDI